MRAPLHIGAAFGLALATAGCVRNAGPTETVNPGVGRPPVDPQGRDEHEGVGMYERQLESLNAERAKKVSTGEVGFEVCEQLCDLMARTCYAKDQLCEIADDHKGVESYQRLCREAKLYCSDAVDSCETCVERDGQTEPPSSTEPPTSSES